MSPAVLSLGYTVDARTHRTTTTTRAMNVAANHARTPPETVSLLNMFCSHARTQGGQASVLKLIAVKEVVIIEGDKTVVGVHNVHAGLLDGAHVERVGVDELHDDHAKDIIVTQRRRTDAWQAAQQIVQGSRSALRRVTRREQPENMIVKTLLLLVKHGIVATFNQHFGRDEAGQRRDLAVELEGVCHGEAVGMARHRYDVFRPENAGLFVNAPADLGECEPVSGRVKLLKSTSDLDGLKRHAAHTRLLQCEIDKAADLIIVESTLQGDDQRGGDSQPVKAFESTPAHVAQVGAAQGIQRSGVQRIELQVDFEVGHIPGEPFGELFFSGESQPVGVHHQVADRPSLGGVENGKEIRMHRRLAA